MTNPYESPQQPDPYSSYGYGADYSTGYQATPTPGASGQLDAIDTLGQAFKIFAERPGSWLLSALTYVVGLLVLGGIGIAPFAVFASTNTDANGELTQTPPVGLIALLVLCGVAAVVWVVLFEMVIYREAVYAVSGKRPEFKDFFTYRRCAFLFLVSLVVGLLSMLGLIGLIVGAFVVSFFLMFAVPAAVFEDMTVGSALKSSANIVKNNLGHSLLLYILLTIIVSILGMVPFAAIFSVPYYALAVSHAYLVGAQRPVQRRT